MGRPSVLPLGMAPLGLSREQAAEYVGVGGTLFDQMVDDGRMPQAKHINARKVWHRPALDAAFAALPDENDRNPWDREARA